MRASDDHERFRVEVERKAERMRRARQRKRSAWRALAQVGHLGFLLVLPLVGGGGGGWLIARSTGTRGAAIAGLLIGLALGLLLAGLELRKILKEPRSEP